jgi:HAD superfamily phosphatase (TIGR01668 family)
MKLYPNAYFKKVTDITVEFLNKNNIKGLMLDIDNTLLDYDLNMVEGLEVWHEEMIKNGIKTIILSNTNKEKKAKMLAEKINIDYILFAMKPLKRGFMKAKDKLQLEEKNLAIVGDQIFTDIIGGNNCNMFSILVEPIDRKDIFITKIKRPIENLVIKKYLKSKEKEEK